MQENNKQNDSREKRKSSISKINEKSIEKADVITIESDDDKEDDDVKVYSNILTFQKD